MIYFLVWGDIMSALEFELAIKQTVIQMHKNMTGIGPRSVFVQAVKNMIIVQISGCFTVLEKQLLQEKGRDYVIDLRETLLKAGARIMDPKDLGITVIDFHINLAPEKDSMHCFLVCEELLDAGFAKKIV